MAQTWNTIKAIFSYVAPNKEFLDRSKELCGVSHAEQDLGLCDTLEDLESDVDTTKSEDS